MALTREKSKESRETNSVEGESVVREKTTRRKGREDKAIWVDLEQRRRQHRSNDTQRNSTVHQERYPWKTCESLRSPPAAISANLDRKNPITVSFELLGTNPCQMSCSTSGQSTSKTSHVTVPRSLTKTEEPIESIHLHGFGDASGMGVSAAVYATVRQPL